MTYCVGVQVDDGLVFLSDSRTKAILRRDALQLALHRSIEPDDAYFKVIRDGWGESLRNAFHALPDPPIP